MRPPSARTRKVTFCSQKCSFIYRHQTAIAKFETKFKKIPKGCWIWEAGKTNYGYGEFCKQLAHRFSYEFFKGKIPKDKIILHTCDIPSCVNPQHLKIGTQKDNIRDASKKHRINHGEDRPQHKLTTVQVLEIRKLYANKTMNQKKLAETYKVSQRNIFNIVHRFRWIHC